MWWNELLKDLQVLLISQDNAFSTISFLQNAWGDWNIAIITTQSGNTKHLLKDHVSIHIFFAFFTFDRLTIFGQGPYNLTKHHYSFELKVLICFFLLHFFIFICSFFLPQLKFVKIVSLTKAFLGNNGSIPKWTKLDQILKKIWKQKILLFLNFSYQNYHLFQILSLYLIQNSYDHLYLQ